MSRTARAERAPRVAPRWSVPARRPPARTAAGPGEPSCGSPGTASRSWARCFSWSSWWSPIAAPVVAPYRYTRQDLLNTYGAPDARHLVGTDALGRDVLSRLMYGARVSMSAGLVTTAIVLAIGVPTGLIAGYFGGTFDLLLMRVVDVVYAIPSSPARPAAAGLFHRVSARGQGRSAWCGFAC